MENKFYAYKHIRPDTGKVFYVGKGHGPRAWDFAARNNHHKNIVAKLRRNGMEPIVHIVRDNMSERCAFVLERILIAIYKEEGAKLANLSNGGEGPSGYRHTEEARKKIAEASAKRVHTPESIAKRVAKRKGYRPTPETILKLSESHKGYKWTDEQRKNFSKSRKGRKHSPEHVAAISKALTGKKKTDEERRIIAEKSPKRPVLCINDGMVHVSVKEAAAFYGLPEHCVRDCCLGRQRQTKKFKFEYAGPPQRSRG